MDVVEYIKSLSQEKQAVLVEFLSEVGGYESAISEFARSKQLPKCGICDQAVTPDEQFVNEHGIIHRSCR